MLKRNFVLKTQTVNVRITNDVVLSEHLIVISNRSLRCWFLLCKKQNFSVTTI